MGSAPSIKELEAKEDDFDAWVSKRTKEVVEECTTARTELLAKFTEDFNKYGDYTTIRDKYWADFTHEETFSLAAISDIIQKVTGALFGASDAGEGGVDVTKPAKADIASAGKDLAQMASGFASVEAVIAVKAMNLIAGILKVFDTKSSLMGTFQSGWDELAPGLFVGISARRTEYSGDDWLHGTRVLESYFVVLVKFSHQAWLDNQDMLTDFKRSEELDAYRENFGDKFAVEIAKIDPFDEKSVDTLTKAIDLFDKTVKKLEGRVASV